MIVELRGVKLFSFRHIHLWGEMLHTNQYIQVITIHLYDFVQSLGGGQEQGQHQEHCNLYCKFLKSNHALRELSFTLHNRDGSQLNCDVANHFVCAMGRNPNVQ
jgi:hypothetical protein